MQRMPLHRRVPERGRKVQEWKADGNYTLQQPDEILITTAQLSDQLLSITNHRVFAPSRLNYDTSSLTPIANNLLPHQYHFPADP